MCTHVRYMDIIRRKKWVGAIVEIFTYHVSMTMCPIILIIVMFGWCLSRTL